MVYCTMVGHMFSAVVMVSIVVVVFLDLD